jgi:hypothetical protein
MVRLYHQFAMDLGVPAVDPPRKHLRQPCSHDQHVKGSQLEGGALPHPEKLTISVCPVATLTVRGEKPDTDTV